LDVYTLALPEGMDAEQLSLRIGLYLSDTGARVPISVRSGERLSDDAIVIPVRDLLAGS
jgi:hypothetical protein